MQKITIPYGKQFIDRHDEDEVKKSLKAKLITTGSYVLNFESISFNIFNLK